VAGETGAGQGVYRTALGKLVRVTKEEAEDRSVGGARGDGGSGLRAARAVSREKRGQVAERAIESNRVSAERSDNALSGWGA
jgi:hypothetical protein